MVNVDSLCANEKEKITGLILWEQFICEKFNAIHIRLSVDFLKTKFIDKKLEIYLNAGNSFFTMKSICDWKSLVENVSYKYTLTNYLKKETNIIMILVMYP